MPALVLAEHDGHTIRPSTLNTVTAAARAGGDVHILVAGHNAANAATEAAKISGDSKFCWRTLRGSPTVWPSQSPRR